MHRTPTHQRPSLPAGPPLASFGPFAIEAAPRIECLFTDGTRVHLYPVAAHAEGAHTAGQRHPTLRGIRVDAPPLLAAPRLILVDLAALFCDIADTLAGRSRSDVAHVVYGLQQDFETAPDLIAAAAPHVIAAWTGTPGPAVSDWAECHLDSPNRNALRWVPVGGVCPQQVAA